jgi:hypothetical protein
MSIAMVVLMGLASLAVDYARVQVVKTQLRRAVDAAARYGATGLANGNAVAWAQAAAADNTVNGSAFSLQSGDVQSGNWSGGTFTAGAVPANAMKITANLSAARGNAVPLLFGQAIGMRSCDVHASCTAFYMNSPPGGIVGYGAIDAKNNSLFASYNSLVDTDPKSNSASSNAVVGSNGTVDGGNNGTIKGNVFVGPSGSLSGFSVTGQQVTQALSQPTMPAWSLGANPGALPADYTVSGNVTLPAGTYTFTSLTISNGTVTFTGPATISVNGPIVVNANLYAYNLRPANLRLYQYGNNQFGDSGSNTMDVVADIWAPTSDFVMKNNGKFRGRCYFKSFTAKNNGQVYYDESFGPASGGLIQSLVQ